MGSAGFVMEGAVLPVPNIWDTHSASLRAYCAYLSEVVGWQPPILLLR